jgi:mannose/fructose/N-acetylgalactosamine-specific phosphotransferase system component IIC
MRSHVKLLGTLQLAWGAMGLLVGGSLLLLAVGAGAIARTSPGDPFTAMFTAVLFLVFAAALFISGWANAWAGRGVQRHRGHARIVSLVLAVLNLFVLPFGTALAIYAFWVLLHNDARALFEARPAA